MRTAAVFITELGQGFADVMDDGTDLAPAVDHHGSARPAPHRGHGHTEPRRVSPTHRTDRRLPARRHRLPLTGPSRQPGNRTLRTADGRPRLRTGCRKAAPSPPAAPGL